MSARGNLKSEKEVLNFFALIFQFSIYDENKNDLSMLVIGLDFRSDNTEKSKTKSDTISIHKKLERSNDRVGNNLLFIASMILRNPEDGF